MPTRAQIENALRTHFEAWHANFSPPDGQKLDPYFMQKD